MKKNRKKLTAVALIIVLTMLMTAGCKKKATPENLFGDMKKNMKEVESFGANIKASVAMADASDAISAEVDLNIETVLKQEAAHVEGSIKMNMSGTDIGTELEIYQVKEKKENTTYVKVLNQWM